MKYREYIDENTLLNILEIGLSPYSKYILYVCNKEKTKKKIEEKYKDILNKIVLTKREIYSDKALIGKLYKEYKFVK